MLAYRVLVAGRPAGVPRVGLPHVEFTYHSDSDHNIVGGAFIWMLYGMCRHRHSPSSKNMQIHATIIIMFMVLLQLHPCRGNTLHQTTQDPATTDSTAKQELL